MTTAAEMRWDEIKALVASLAIQSQETERRFQETDRRFQETERRFQVTERRFQVTERRFQVTERRFQETERLLKERSEETERRFQETDRKFQETDREIKETARLVRELRESTQELSRRFGDLGNRLGEFVEAMVEPSLVGLFRERGLEVREVFRNLPVRCNEERLKLDLFISSSKMAIAAACKSRLTVSEVECHLERMAKIKRLMPAYRDYRLHGAVSGMTLDEEAIALAEREGLWVLGQSGETVVVKNRAGFEPKVW